MGATVAPASALAQLGATFGRDLSFRGSVAALVVLQCGFLALVVLAAARRGSPRTWSAGLVTLVAVAGVAAAAVWVWVDRGLEGKTLVSLSQNHGITTGDLLCLPTLFGALLVVVCKALGPPAEQ